MKWVNWLLSNNYRQTQALSLAESDARYRMEEYRRFMEYLESDGRLDRAIEYLPDNDALAERAGSGQSLTRPELATLVSYSKLDLKESLVCSTVIDESYLSREVFTAFPKVLVEQFTDQLLEHRLKKEIVATQIANHMIDMMGITYALRVRQTTGASSPDIARAFVISRDVFNVDHYWQAIEKLDYTAPSSLQQQMMGALTKLVRRASRWFIRLKRQDLIAAETVAHFSPLIEEFTDSFHNYLSEAEQEETQQQS